MNFIRRSLAAKGVFVFTLLLAGGVAAVIGLRRSGIETLDLNVFFAALLGLAALILALFLANVFWPLSRLTREVRRLLGGQDYKRVPPVTADETGVVTHFFNEITRDLEKIAYDLKERRRMSSELDIAAGIQRDVLPKQAPAIQGLDIIAKNRAAAEIGGDIFDFLPSPGSHNTYLYIGDVTGHGVPAGLVMVMASTIIRAMISQGPESGREVVVHTNELLTPRISTRLFMTCVVLRWDAEREKMYFTGAGHEHVVVYRAKTESVEAIRSGGIALGMIPDVSKIAREQEIPLEVGDSLILYSDGITEAKNKTGEMYGLERLKEAVKSHGYLPDADSVFDRLTQEFSKFVGAYVQVDDITLMVIKIVGKNASPAAVRLSVENEATAPRQSKLWNWTA